MTLEIRLKKIYNKYFNTGSLCEIVIDHNNTVKVKELPNQFELEVQELYDFFHNKKLRSNNEKEKEKLQSHLENIAKFLSKHKHEFKKNY